MSTCTKAVEGLDYEKGVKGVEASIRWINQQGYASGQEWFAGVPEKVFDFDPDAGGEGNEDEDDEEQRGDGGEDEDEDNIIFAGGRRRKLIQSAGGKANDGDEDDPEGVLLPGLHTMMHDTLDFLSEERTRELEKWKKQFLQKLDRLDKSAKSPAVNAKKAVAVD